MNNTFEKALEGKEYCRNHDKERRVHKNNERCDFDNYEISDVLSARDKAIESFKLVGKK